MDATANSDGEIAAKLDRLGYPPDARLLIVNGDDIGMCHAANAATFDAMEHGIMTAASLMVPCPWAYPAALYLHDHPTLDVGVHLTLTSEWQGYRWGPLIGRERGASLLDEEGFFPHNQDGVFAKATIAEAQEEAVAQIERALAWGLDPTNLDGHMGTFSGHPAFVALYVELARAYRLPLRVRTARLREQQAADARYAAIDLAGIMTPDAIQGIRLTNPELLERDLVATLRALPPGVTELVLHASQDTPEARAISRDWPARAEAYRLVTRAAPIRELLDELGIVRIGWRSLREAQRGG